MTTTEAERCRGSCEPCGLRSFKRNRYFDGKLLVTADFQDEQSYLRGKDRLHASHLHGAGTVCGLKLRQHPNPACRNRYVTLEPGLALDCCGNEIVVDREVQIDLRAAIEEALRERQLFPLDEAGRDVFVHLAYRECDIEAVPSLGDACGCDDHGREYGRTREEWELFVGLDRPEAAARDPLDVGLSWQQTLAVGRPEAVSVDRLLERLYVAESDGEAGALRMYDTENHSLIRRQPLRDDDTPRRPTAVAGSLLGDLVYVALMPLPDAAARVDVFLQVELEGAGDVTRHGALDLPGDPSPVLDLHVSARDDSLLALLDDGRVLRWTSEQLRAGAGDPQVLSLTGTDAAGLVVSNDGRWAVVLDRAGPALVVVSLAQFRTATIAVPDLLAGNPVPAAVNLVAAFRVPHADAASPPIPDAAEYSFDGQFLYVISQAGQHLYRIQVRTALDDYIPLAEEPQAYTALPLVEDPAAPDVPVPVDVAVSLRDSWVYVLRRLSRAGNPIDRGQVAVVPVEGVLENRGVLPPSAAAELIRDGAPTEGVALFQRLAFLGARLYVAGQDPPGDGGEATSGSISVLFVDEAECGTFFRNVVEGCQTCEGPASIVLASIERYRWDVDIVDAGQGEDRNELDNSTHRDLLPSTATLKQVIDCMLEKGITEGVPGPRGPEGPVGPRGPAVTEVTATAAEEAGARLVPLPGDPEGDFRLELDLPQGPIGDRGPGVTEVELRTIDAGQPPRANLEPLPSGDFRLVLELPRQQEGERPTFNAVGNASWHLDEVFTPEQLGTFLSQLGLAVAFEQPVDSRTLHQRSVYALVRRRSDESPFFCDCVWPLDVEPLRDVTLDGRDVTWLVGENPETGAFDVIARTEPAEPGEPAIGVRLLFPRELREPQKLAAFVEQQSIAQITVVLESDWILDRDQQALDGNHIWPGVPDRVSGNGTAGGNWVSALHLRRQ